MMKIDAGKECAVCRMTEEERENTMIVNRDEVKEIKSKGEDRGIFRSYVTISIIVSLSVFLHSWDVLSLETSIPILAISFVLSSIVFYFKYRSSRITLLRPSTRKPR